MDIHSDLDETLGDVVAFLVQRLPDVSGARERVIAAVGGLHLSGARARTFADYIGRTPDALTSTRSDGPKRGWRWCRFSPPISRATSSPRAACDADGRVR